MVRVTFEVPIKFKVPYAGKVYEAAIEEIEAKPEKTEIIHGEPLTWKILFKFTELPEGAIDVCVYSRKLNIYRCRTFIPRKKEEVIEIPIPGIYTRLYPPGEVWDEIIVYVEGKPVAKERIKFVVHEKKPFVVPKPKPFIKPEVPKKRPMAEVEIIVEEEKKKEEVKPGEAPVKPAEVKPVTRKGVVEVAELKRYEPLPEIEIGRLLPPCVS